MPEPLLCVCQLNWTVIHVIQLTWLHAASEYLYLKYRGILILSFKIPF